MPGAASVEGTRRYAQRAIDQGISASAYRGLGRTGLVNSSLGFGSYRIDDRTPEHASALDKALLSGVNLIDTSTNYTDGSSESCIGNVLARQQREELIVVSKVGYVQEQALATARTREQRGSAFPEMVKYTEGCWHCIHPEFLADQLGRSLGRLRVEKVDVYLLHNPETSSRTLPSGAKVLRSRRCATSSTTGSSARSLISRTKFEGAESASMAFPRIRSAPWRAIRKQLHSSACGRSPGRWRTSITSP